MSQTIELWEDTVEAGVSKLFDGSDESINALTALISDGKFIPGKLHYPPIGDTVRQESAGSMRKNMAKSFFAYAVPAIWQAAGEHPFVVDSGYRCGTIDPLKSYMDVETMRNTWACYEDKLYYLVLVKGEAQTKIFDHDSHQETIVRNKFSAPAGVTSLGGELYGGVSVTDLITGYAANTPTCNSELQHH